MADYQRDLIGEHPSIDALRLLIARVARSPARTVLIYGETGTGKGLVARMLHQQSARATGEFVDINCAAIPDSLLESELFGHERGAFTGAQVKKAGLVEAAHKGTVFLDEIREMDLVLQAKLLSFLDTQSFRRVGAVTTTSVDVRLVAATNKILLGEVTSGRFREDLYYRLQVVAINLPALRERASDVLILSRHFIDKFNRLYNRQIVGLSPDVQEIFLKYPWPGNVRELENLIERIFILEDEDVIQTHHLPDRILRSVRARGQGQGPSSGSREDAEADLTLGFHEATAHFQKRLIEQALKAADDNLQRAATSLKISRHAMRHQMIKLGLLSE